MSYSLCTSFIGESLISGFNWINYPDPSNGFVSYQTQEDAQSMGLYSVDPDTQVVRLGVDYTNKFDVSEGRPSLRLESKEAFNHGLWIADFLHMPPSQCGVWPAFWAYGADWPNDGELDIIEGANLVYSNIMAGHTADGCSLDPADEGLFTGERRNLDCSIGTQNIGCGYNPPGNDTSSYGDGFNAVDGGVYAVQWDSEYLRVWHFARGSIPADIEAKTPDPSNWGLPQSIFGGSKCDVDTFYKNMNIVININFCGDYSSGTWNNYDTCTELAPTCEEYVANNPEAFENVYWAVKYIDVYESVDDTTLPSNSTMPVAVNETTPLTTPTYQPTTDAAGTPFPSEPAATTIMTTWSTVVVTMPGASTPSPFPSTPPSSDLPSASNKPTIGDYTYLGCFRSSSNFRTFELALDSAAMTIEKCIDACGGLTYVGVFERKCYCAESIDADTRSLPDALACDHVCPGDEDEFCGGLVSGRNNGTARRRLLRRDAPNYYLLSVYADLSETEEPEIPPAMGNPVPSPSNTDSSTTAAAVVSSTSSSEPSSVTVTVVASQEAQFVNPLTTTLTYTILCPTNPSSLMATELVTVVEDCGCTEQPALPMETKVVECEGCGRNGANTVTITVPVTTTATQVVGVTVTAEAAKAAETTVEAMGTTIVVEDVQTMVEPVATTPAAMDTTVEEVAEMTAEPAEPAETTLEAIGTTVDEVVEVTAQPDATTPGAPGTTPGRFVEMTVEGAGTTLEAATATAGAAEPATEASELPVDAAQPTIGVSEAATPDAAQLTAEAEQQTQTQLNRLVAIPSAKAATPQGFTDRVRPVVSTPVATPEVVLVSGSGWKEVKGSVAVTMVLAVAFAVLL